MTLETYPRGVLVALAAVYLAAFLAYYPPLNAIEDEVDFINQAVVWAKRLTVAQDVSPALQDSDADPGRNPGRSFITAPIVAVGGVRARHLSGAVIHLAIFVVGALTLEALGVPPIWAALLLFHPTLVLYSRTVMGDSLSGLMLLAALYAVLALERPGLIAGCALAGAVVARYQAAIVIPAFLAAMFLDERLARWKEMARAAAVIAGVGAALIVYNLRVHGVPIFTAGHTLSDLDVAFVPGNLFAYGSALLIIWPLMAAAPFLLRPPLRNYALAVIVPVTAVLLFYYFHDSHPSFWVTLVVAPRLLQIALPAWIVAYATVLDRVAGRRVHWTIATVAIVAMATGTVLINRAHQQYLNRLKSIRDDVIARVPAGSTVIANWSLDHLFGVIDDVGYGVFTWLGTDEPLPAGAADRSPMYLVLSSKHGYDAPPPELLSSYRAKFVVEAVPDVNSELEMFQLRRVNGTSNADR